MTHSKYYLLVDSEDRSTLSYSSSDFVINLPRVYKDISKVKLLSYTITNSIYTVNNTNYRLNLIEAVGGATTVVSLTQKNYNGSTLATELKTQLDAVSANGYTYTCSYDANTLKFTISTINNFSLTFDLGASAYKILGFEKIPSSIAIATSRTSDNIIRLDQPNTLMETNLTNHLKTTNNGVNCSFLLNLPSIASTQTYSINNTYDYEIDDQEDHINQICIRLKDRENRTLNFNGGNHQFIFELIPKH